MERALDNIAYWSEAWHSFLERIVAMGHYRADQMESFCSVERSSKFLGSVAMWNSMSDDEDCDWLVECGLVYRDSEPQWVFKIEDSLHRVVFSEDSVCPSGLTGQEICFAFAAWSERGLAKLAEVFEFEMP
jgi:hypothetical protein